MLKAAYQVNVLTPLHTKALARAGTQYGTVTTQFERLQNRFVAGGRFDHVVVLDQRTNGDLNSLPGEAVPELVYLQGVITTLGIDR